MDDLIPSSHVVRYPALRAWHGALAAGIAGQDPDRPRTWILDDLWRAAAWEAAAQEAAGTEQWDTWNHCIDRASESLARFLLDSGELDD